MKVVFFEDVEGTAQVGEVKEVKNGFARNFLLPRGVAGSTSKDNLQRANSLAQKEARRQEKLDGAGRPADPPRADNGNPEHPRGIPHHLDRHRADGRA